MSVTVLPENIYDAKQVRAIEREVIGRHGVAGVELMRRAGEAAFKHIVARGVVGRMVVVCGGGNNGGDGYVVARCARGIGIEVSVVSVAEPATDDAAAVADEYKNAGGAVAADPTLINDAGLVVDALFGTGLNRAPAAAAADCIRRMNAVAAVVSLDVPSGLDADSGRAFEPCVTADATVTFVGVKLGLLTGDGRAHAGRIIFCDLGVTDDAKNTATPAARIIRQPRLQKRAATMHKGDAGRVTVVGGDAGMLGAALLAGEAALRCGGGLVRVAGVKQNLDLPALRCPALMSGDALKLNADADAVVLGPGLGRRRWSRRVFARYINYSAPMVVDADGLNQLARAPRRRDDWVLTPHAGEAARLLNTTVAAVQGDRPAAARAIADRFGGVCVLKGTGTLVAVAADAVAADAAGDAAAALFVSDAGNPGMASGGMGDVLSGVIGALLAQGVPLAAAATAGVWLHCAAADAAAVSVGERGLLAHDVVERLAATVAACEV